MAAISASGDAIIPLCIFTYTLLPYRNLEFLDGTCKVESAAHILPEDSLLATRKAIGGIDGLFFIEWYKKLD